MSLDVVPMLLLSLLLLTAGGEAQTAELVLAGDHEAAGHRGALVVADANVTVPAGVEVSGPVHLLGGQTRILGTVDGDVTHIAGTLVVGDGARISGTLQHIGGTLHTAPGADIARRSGVEALAGDPGPARRLVPLALVTGLLALVGARRARRNPRSLEHMRTAISGHPVVSLTVGALVTVTFLSLFVFMAFTLILLPVSIIGLAGGLVVLGYAIVALGSLAAQRLPIRSPGLATAAGVVAVMAALQLLGVIPILGSVAVGGLLLTGLGAVLLTYVGLKEFTPVHIPH